VKVSSTGLGPTKMTGEQQTVCVSEMAQHLYLIFVFPLFFVWICFFEASAFFLIYLAFP
jgi:hypothetical protein